jgi:uncharacterized protein YkwD
LAVASLSALLRENIYFYQDLRLTGLFREVTRMFQQGWMNSAGHRKNILTLDFKKFGGGGIQVMI